MSPHSAQNPAARPRDLAVAELLAAVHAADEEEDDPEERARHLTPSGNAYLPPRRHPDQHRLERPLQVLLSFTQQQGTHSHAVDVLEYADGGWLLSLALPPELELSEGEHGEIRLLRKDPPSEALPFEVLRLEPGSLVKLAMIRVASA